MKNFLKHIILFSIPLWLVVLFVWIIDPVNYWGYNNIIPQELKNTVLSSYAGTDMIKQGEIKKIFFRSCSKDCNCWIVGDSRTAPISVEYVDSLSKGSWYNMGLAGCYTRSAVSSFFWMLENSSNKPKMIYWGHNFWSANYKDYFIQIEDYGETPLTYITSSFTWKLIYNTMKTNNYHKQINSIGEVEMWSEVINRKIADIKNEHIRVQPIIYELIDSVSHYCERYDIRLIHVYPPEYKDLLAIIQSDSITNAEYQKYLDHLSQYEFYNFNQGHWIESSNDFVDPMHPKKHVYNNMIDSIFGD